MHKYNHLIWDWNGTLLEDIDLCVSVINGMLTRRAMMPITLESYRQAFTFPVSDYYQTVGFDFSVEPFETLSVEFIQGYETGVALSGLMPGAIEILEKIHQMGLSQFVLSAREANRLRDGIRDLGLEGWFTAIYGLEDHHAAGKRHRGLALIREQNLDPNKTLMIGDTVHDAEVAAAMGIDCWLVSNGHQDRERLEATGVPVIERLIDIPGRLRDYQP